MDFGSAGQTLDPTSGVARQSWVFVLVLSWSRHLYAEVVFDQRVETWLWCHRHAFEWFDGAPARVVPDNVKAAIVRASRHEPVAQRAYRECAQHDGCLIDPTPLAVWSCASPSVQQKLAALIVRERLDERRQLLWLNPAAGHETPRRNAVLGGSKSDAKAETQQPRSAAVLTVSSTYFRERPTGYPRLALGRL